MYIDYSFGDPAWEYSYSNTAVTLIPLLDCIPDKISFSIAYAGSNVSCSMSCTVTANGETLASITDSHQGNAKTETYILYIGQEIAAFTNITINWYFTNAGIQRGTVEYNGILYKASGTAPKLQYTVYVNQEYYWITDNQNNGYIWCGVLADPTPFQGYVDPKPLNSWKIDTNNNGYPWTWGFTEIVVGQNIFLKTKNELIPLTPYYKTDSGLIPLTAKVKE